MDDGALLQSLRRHADIVTCLALGADASTLVSGAFPHIPVLPFARVLNTMYIADKHIIAPYCHKLNHLHL